MFRFPITTLMLVSVASCAANVEPSAFPDVKEATFRTSVSFSRNDYVAHFTITNSSGQKVIEISCYSLDDERREKFALENKTDPVADLSCYVKDINRANEFTMLGLDGESLQFTPGFFWLSDLEKCGERSYRMDAKLRGLSISFTFSRIDAVVKRSSLEISVSRDASAVNEKISDQTFRSYCS